MVGYQVVDSIYVVFGTCGSYSDQTEWNVAAFFDEQVANLLCDRLKRILQFNAQFHKRQQEEFHNKVTRLQPLAPEPLELPPGFREVQEACANRRGSPEAKQEMKRLQAIHIKNIEEHRKKMRQWYDEVDKVNDAIEQDRKEWFKKNYVLPPDLTEAAQFVKYDGSRAYGFNSDDTRYAVTQVKLYKAT